MGFIRFLKNTLLFVVLLVLFVAIAVVFGISDTASAPFIGIRVDSSTDEAFIDTSDVPTIPDTHGEDTYDTQASPEDPQLELDDYVTIVMNLSDIYSGDLILINSENRYDIPDEIDLVDIKELKTSSYRVADNVSYVSGTIIDALNRMMDDFCEETGCDTVTVISAFRSYKKQQEILNEYISIFGASEARKWAAEPGFSEHHTGMAVDFGIISSGSLRSFLGTGIYAWFFDNCNRYGFIHRYPENKTNITQTTYEPWHFRYVGVPHAYFIRHNRLCLEEYIEFIRDFTSDEPYIDTYNGEEYEVYFTMDSEIHIPFDCEFDISGNNIDGFIVTIKHEDLSDFG